jgi:hypothetical protein
MPQEWCTPVLAKTAVMLGVVVCLTIGACTQEIGTNLDLSKADLFKSGVTTYDEAVAQLGKPAFIRKYPDGRTGAAWQYTKGTAFSGGSAKGVGIVFSANGVMERMTGRTEIGSP